MPGWPEKRMAFFVMAKGRRGIDAQHQIDQLIKAKITLLFWFINKNR